MANIGSMKYCLAVSIAILMLTSAAAVSGGNNTFPDKPYAKVVAYAFAPPPYAGNLPESHNLQDSRMAQVLKSKRKKCLDSLAKANSRFDTAEEPVMLDGLNILHPAAFLPGKVLTLPQERKLLKLLNDSSLYGYTSSACLDWDIGFVFYDNKDRVVDHVTISFGCRKLSSDSPYLVSLGDPRNPGLGRNYYGLYELCKELGFGAYDPLGIMESKKDTVYTFSIHEQLPEYRIMLTLKASPPGSGYRIEAINVHNHKAFLQDLSASDETWSIKGETLPPSSDFPLGKFIAARDINFDGYRDLLIRNPLSGSSGEMFECWIFDPDRLRFGFHKGLSALCDLQFDPKNKTVSGACKTGYNSYASKKYQLMEGRLQLVKEEDQQYDQKLGLFHVRTRIFNGKEWQTHKKIFGEDGR